MPVPSTFSALNTTPSSNSPAGSEAPSTLDDHQRALWAFIASIYANTSTNGWTTPYAALAGATFTGAVTGITDLVNTGNTSLGSSSANTLNVGNGGIVKDASGNVGIGGSPSNKLDVIGSQDSALISRTVNSSTGSSAKASLQLDTQGGSWSITNSRSGGALTFLFGSTETVRLDGSGNVGIGMNSFGTSAAGVLALVNATAPGSSPAGGGQLYVEAGALKYRGSSGTITTIAVA